MKRFYLIGLAIIVASAGCSVLNHKKHEYSGTFKVSSLRSIWMGCYQKGVNQMAMPPFVASSCDCYVDSLRAEFIEEDISNTELMNKNKEKLKKLAAACIAQAQGFPQTYSEQGHT